MHHLPGWAIHSVIRYFSAKKPIGLDDAYQFKATLKTMSPEHSTRDLDRNLIGRRNSSFHFIGLLFVLSASLFFLTGYSRADGPASYTGSDACQSCHLKAYTDWKASHHHAAMQQASSATVLGRFDDAKFTEGGIESTFFRKDGKYWVRTDGPDGKLADFEIRYTFGVYPLQQYLIELSPGRYQALGIAWDSRPAENGGQRWYHLYPGQKLQAGDPLHWTGIDQNWNYQCAWCHSTNSQKNYDRARKTFQTTWSEINVGCEACHGPASGHLAWTGESEAEREKNQARGFAFRLNERTGVTWTMSPQGQAARSAGRQTTKEIEVCATCHARRQQFSSDPQSLGRLLDAFRPATLESGLYHVDGQQRDEVFNHGSFVQSKMYAAGVTCSDCHNPHSGKLHEDGNGVCAQCHAPKKFDSAAHHHHPVGSPGAQCTSCHMPTTTYMGVDARHDHSMRIPRPDRTINIGTPNACNKCHTDKSASWARDAIKAWYPLPKPGFQDFAETFDVADRQAPSAQAALAKIAGDLNSSPIAQASALARLARFPSPEALEIAARSLVIDDAAVRTAAITIIAGADAGTRRALLTPLLRDSSRLVRADAARAIAGEPEAGLSEADRSAFATALAEYVEGQLFNAERPESHANIGNLYADQGRLEDARAAFRTAIELDPRFAGASIAWADLERTAGNESAAEDILRKSLAENPSSGAVAHALALSMIRQKRTADAMTYLSLAAGLAPGEARFSYVLAVAQHDTGMTAEAMTTLKSAIARHPYDRDLLMAMISYELEAGSNASALERAELLYRLEPNSPQIAQLLTSLRSRNRR